MSTEGLRICPLWIRADSELVECNFPHLFRSLGSGKKMMLLLKLGLASVFKPGLDRESALVPALMYLQVSEAIKVSIHQSLLLGMALQCLSSEEKEQQLI